MKTSYIKFCQQTDDPVWGDQALTWIKTPLVRVTRNSLHKAHFEWVGNTTEHFDVNEVRRVFPLALYV
jgi:hypothetical protein